MRSIAIDSLPVGVRDLAHYVDRDYGNGDGSLNAAEIDRFDAVHGEHPVYRQHLIIPVRNRLGISGDAVKPHDPALRTRPSADDARTRLALAMVRRGGAGTEADCAAVREQLEHVPLAVLETLDARGCRIVACRDSVTNYRTELQATRPPGWPPGRTWDDVPGAHFWDRDEVVIATVSLNGRRSISRPGGTVHNCANMVVHEVGHALDFNTGATDTEEFRRAYQADLDSIGPYERGDPREAFAETFAMWCVSRREVLRIKRPHLFAYFETLLG